VTPSEQKIKLYDLCKRFVDENNVWEACCVTDNDKTYLNSIDLVVEICEIVGYKEFTDDE